MQIALTAESLATGVDILTACDPDLAHIVERLGPPPLWARPPGFPTLIRIILEQQVSLASARAAFERLCAVLDPLTPESFLSLGDEALRAIGFSRQKARYSRELALEILSGRLDLTALSSLPDHEVRAELTRVKGIGEWSANIYLLLSLLRPDAWPAGDLALALAVQRVKALDTRPTPFDLEQMSEAWRPWRAVAARLFWHEYLSGRSGF